MAWYAAEGRALPWRRTRDPYAILVSEVMLQQTQVARVAERWTAWLARWPTAAALADARRADVLSAWVGLGYNSRALRLQEACRVVVASGWPEDLRALPGVGPYTAAAVGAFAFGRQEVALDTNLRRVLGRFGAGDGAGLAPPAGRAADFNQAMMDLGALVCTARVARCDICPVVEGCASRWEPAVRPAPGVSRRTERFEDTNRWVRGRVVAALAAGEPPPPEIEPGRLARAVESLLRDGLLTRGPGGLSLG